MNRSMPLTAILLGLAGLIPMIGCGLVAMGEDPVGADHGFTALIAYAAVILSFTGAVHWGLALNDGAASLRVQRMRYALGVLPAVIGWIALLVPMFVPVWASLVVLIAGFIATPVMEARGAHLGYVPGRYMALRWLLSFVVVAVLLCVLVVRLLGAHIRL
jgi:hypothetical protein